MRKINVIIMILLTTQSFGQLSNPRSYEGNLIEFLTEVNLRVEGHMNKHFCSCKENAAFLDAYTNIRIAQNKFINAMSTELATDKSSSAISKFLNRNTQFWVNQSNSDIHDIVETASKFLIPPSCKTDDETDDESSAFTLPTAVSIAELTGVANSIIGLINSGKARKDAIKATIVKSLENLKIPSAGSYKCGK